MVSVKRRTPLSASASAKSLWFRSLSLSWHIVCCSPVIFVVTVRVGFIRFFHGSYGLSNMRLSSCIVAFVPSQTSPSGIVN